MLKFVLLLLHALKIYFIFLKAILFTPLHPQQEKKKKTL